MSGPFRSEAPYLEEQLRALEEDAVTLEELVAEIARERGLRQRPSQLAFTIVLVAVLASMGGFLVGRFGGLEAARRRSQALVERTRTEADSARASKEACEAALVVETATRDACSVVRAKVRDGGPEVFVNHEHGSMALDARVAFFRVGPLVDACAGATSAEVVAFVTFAASGEPTEVELHTTEVTATGKACAERVLRGTRLPPFAGEPVVVRATFMGDFVTPRVARRRVHL